MGGHSTLDIAIGIVAGIIFATILLIVYFKKTLGEKEKVVEEKQRLLEEKNKLIRDELIQKAEIEIDRKRIKFEQELSEKKAEIKQLESKAESAISSAENEQEIIERRRTQLEKRLDQVDDLEEKARSISSEYREKLQVIAKMDLEEIKKSLFEEVERECEDEIRELKQERLNQGESEVEEKARRILVDCMQRLSSVSHEDITATIVSLPNDEMKGRIIGREGRNIKSFESITGTTLLIDETPDSVLVSSFDPVRREIARIALEALVKDGRIHPASIEESVKKAEFEVKQSVVETGEDALRRLRLNKMHPEVVEAIGRMRFRLANNQNALEHSIEVANLCALMASELGLDVQIAKRCGLLHDIGKVLSEEFEGSHAKAGANFLRRFGQEEDAVINAVEGHHNEVESISPYLGVLMTADSVSALRPGARAESMDGYIQRIKHLEGVAKSLNGVVDAYAIQAGREIRIIVSPDRVDGENASLMARQVRRKIEDELQYPGTIKVTVIREERFSEVAK